VVFRIMFTDHDSTNLIENTSCLKQQLLHCFTENNISNLLLITSKTVGDLPPSQQQLDEFSLFLPVLWIHNYFFPIQIWLRLYIFFGSGSGSRLFVKHAFFKVNFLSLFLCLEKFLYYSRNYFLPKWIDKKMRKLTKGRYD
jgi:hypothetical protein